LIYYVHSKVLCRFAHKCICVICAICGYVRGKYFKSPSGVPLQVLSRACDVRGRVFSALSDVRGNVFLDVGYRARCCFSIGLKELSSWRFSGKGLFSGFIVSHAIVKLFRVGYRLLFSTYNDVIVFLYGMVRHGNK
jgi:hypothetical protein